jgi:hypothetical protein
VRMAERNRVAIIGIEFDLLSDILLGRVIATDLPVDIEIIGTQPLTLFKMVELVVRSDTFRPLKEGDAMPRLNPLLRKVVTLPTPAPAPNP